MTSAGAQRLLSGAKAARNTVVRHGALKSTMFGGKPVRYLLTLSFVIALCFLFNASFTTPFMGGDGSSNSLMSLADSSNESDPLVCKKKTHIFFMKTHKCASSSIQNIFFRYGDAHNLTLVLPPSNNYFGHPTYFNHLMVPDASKFHVTYSMFASHTRFHLGEVKRVMPRDTIYVTILRDPVTLFGSMYSYYDLAKSYRAPLQDLVRLHQDPVDPIYRQRRFRKFGLNQMAFDLGLQQTAFRSILTVEKFIQRLDETFDLVLIAERMPESLVLLKHLLCWDFDDVVVFKKNARSTKFKRNEEMLTPSDVTTLRTLNAADQKIYDYFNEKLQSRIERFGEKQMAHEVVLLNERSQHWFDECVEEVKKVENEAAARKKSIYSTKVLYFEAKNNSDPECERFLREELAYTSLLRKKQSYINYTRPLQRKVPRS